MTCFLLPLRSPSPVLARVPPVPSSHRSPSSPSLTKLHPQLFYYGGEQLSQQRAEQQLGTQLVALQVLGRGLDDLRAGRFLAEPRRGPESRGRAEQRQGPGSGDLGVRRRARS